MAEVNGALRKVGYSAKKGRLWVEVEDVGEALGLLDKLASGPGVAIEALLSEREKKLLETGLPEMPKRTKPLRVIGASREAATKSEEPASRVPMNTPTSAPNGVEEARDVASTTQTSPEPEEEPLDDPDSIWGVKNQVEPEAPQIYSGPAFVATIPTTSPDGLTGGQGPSLDASPASSGCPQELAKNETQPALASTVEAPSNGTVVAKKRGSKNRTIQDDIQETVPTKLTTSQYVPGAVPPLALDANGVPIQLTGAKRLVDVLNFFIDRDMNDPADLIRECEALKDKIPCLSRVHDFPKQVTQTLKSIGVIPFDSK